MKNICIYLCLLMFYWLSDLQAQNNLAMKQNILKIERSDVINFGFINNEFYLQNSSATFLYKQDGKLVKKMNSDNKQIYFNDAEMKYSISIDGKIIETREKIDLYNISDKLKKESKTAKFLAKSDNFFLTCLVDSGNLSYSNRILKIRDGEFSLFTYLVGIPAGLFIENQTLWYLYNKSNPKSNGMLRKYDLSTGELLFEIEIPVIEPVGLYLKLGLCYVYSNHSKELITLNIGGN